MEVVSKWKTDAADAELVNLTLAGDREPFDALVKRYQRAVYAVAFGVLSDSEAARDVLQDTFLSAYCSLDRLSDPAKFNAWVYAIARNRATGYYRSRRRKHAWEIPLDSVEPTMRSQKDHLKETVHTALSSLTEFQADAVTLHYMEGYSINECADLLGIAAGTVKRRLYDARQKLKKEMTSMIRKHLPEFALPKDFKVVINTSGKTCTTESVLEDLSDMTGIALEAGLSDTDWLVRSRKLNIVAKNVPLADLMDSIASVLNCEWSKSDGEKPSYRLYSDETSRREAEELKKKSQEHFDAEMTRRRQEFLDRMLNWQDVSAEELKRLKEENPCRYLLHARGSGRMYQRLFNEIPGLANCFVNRIHNQAWPAKDLPQETRDLIRQVVLERFKYRGYHGSWDGKPFPTEWDIDRPESQLWFEIVPRDFCWNIDENWDLGGLGYFASREKFFYIEDMLVEDIPLSKYCANCQIRALETGKTYYEVEEELKDECEQAKQETTKDYANCFSVEPVPTETIDDPELSKKIRVKLTGNTLADYQTALAEAGGLAVVSDLYLARKRAAAVVGEREFELRELLDLIAQAYDYSWTKRGKVIEFRDKKWFARSDSQIPAEWIEKWRNSLIEHGHLSLDEYADITALSVEQIEESLMPDELFASTKMFGWGLIDARMLLRLYRKLNQKQRDDLFSPSGLDSRSFDAEQAEMAMETYRYRDESDNLPIYEAIIADPDRWLVFTAKRKLLESGHIAYLFDIHSNDGQQLRHWGLTLPMLQK